MVCRLFLCSPFTSRMIAVSGGVTYEAGRVLASHIDANGHICSRGPHAKTSLVCVRNMRPPLDKVRGRAAHLNKQQPWNWLNWLYIPGVVYEYLSREVPVCAQRTAFGRCNGRRGTLPMYFQVTYVEVLPNKGYNTACLLY